MQQFTAKFISFIFQPLLFPIFAVLYMFNTPTFLALYPSEIKKAIYLIVLMMTIVAPVLIMLIMVNLRMISSLSISDSKERFIPYILTILFMAGTFIILERINVGVPSPITVFFLLAAVASLINLTINFKTKISAHAAGAGGLFGYMAVFHSVMHLNGLIPFIVLTAVTFSVAYARLQLNAHTPAQVYLGSAVGFVSGASSYFYFMIFGL